MKVTVSKRASQKEAKDDEYISKEEVLAGIDRGLKELKLKREGKLQSTSARSFLKELSEGQNKGTRKEEAEDDEYISKEEILAGIDAGLKDMKAGRSKTFEEFMRDWDDEV